MNKKKIKPNKLKGIISYVRENKKRILKYAILAFFTIWIIAAFYSAFLPLPSGISIEGPTYNISSIDFMYDLNYLDDGEQVIEQEIFDEIFRTINLAEDFIVIDMFLFNTDYSEKIRYKNLTTDMKNLLVAKKMGNPEVDIVFITDPINNFYGHYVSSELAEMDGAGINVIITDHTELRDSNPGYAGLWRAYLQWFGVSGFGWISHPLGRTEEKVTLRSYLKLMNTKANHRKVIVADQGSRVVSIITSGNPHEASSKHSNVAIKLYDSVALDILKTEMAVSDFSSDDHTIENILSDISLAPTFGKTQVQLLTEGKIRDNLIMEIDDAKDGEKIEMVMFYLSDRKIIKSLLRASNRGVNIEIILDPNKDAFAREKSGIPNRQVAWELIKKSDGAIKIRWYDTRGEQQHSKITTIRKSDGRIIVFLGSGNLTRRNVGDYNLEMNVKVNAPENSAFAVEVLSFFEMIWTNENGRYTAEFEKYKDTSKLRYFLYRFQEFSGLSSF
jgi:HKD family nuclease